MLEGLNHIAAWWWGHLISAAWQTGVVGAVVLVLVLALGKRWPAPLRYALLVLALLKFACPPWLPVPTGLLAHVAPAAIVRSPLTQATQARAERASGMHDGAEAAVFAVSWKAWLMLCQVLGAGMIGAALCGQLMKVRRVVSRSSLLRLDEETHDFYRDLAIQLGLRRIPPVLLSRDVDGPMTCRLRQPVIVLPESLVDQFCPEETKAVLAHELAHCHRGDLWLNHLQLVLVAFWWFHPVLWLVNRALREVREDCCDDLLLVRGIARNDEYCDVLLRAAAIGTQELAAPVFLRGGMHPLGRRLTRITDASLRRCEAVSCGGAMAVLLGAALVWPGIRHVSTPVRVERGAERTVADAAFEAAGPAPIAAGSAAENSQNLPALTTESESPALSTPPETAAESGPPAYLTAQPAKESPAPHFEQRKIQDSAPATAPVAQSYPAVDWYAQRQAALYHQYQLAQFQRLVLQQRFRTAIVYHQAGPPPMRQYPSAGAVRQRPPVPAYIPPNPGRPWGFASQNIRTR
jgi:beta-lactamase regulating signal transducer with metallopeptidase domain